MADAVLADTQRHADVFRRRILLNARYWQTYVSDKVADISALDNERERIIKAIAFALDLTEAWPSVYGLLVTYTPYMERRGHWEIWNQLLDRAIKVVQNKGDITHQTTLTALLARLLFQQSCFKESAHYYRRVIHLARSVDDKFNEGRACTNLGFYYTEQGQWWRAEVLCCHAMYLFEQGGSDHGRAHTENHLGFLYGRQHRWEQARQHLERACELWQAMGDTHGLMRGYLNLGGLFIDAKQPDPALKYLEKALHQAHVTGENTAIGKVYINMGLAYRLVGDLVQAETYIRQAETIFQRYSNVMELSRIWIELGLIYCQQDRWGEAFFYLEKALEVRRSLGVKFQEIEVLLDMGECELQRGNKVAASARLQEIECLVGSASEQGVYRHLLPRLAQYHQRLEEIKG